MFSVQVRGPRLVSKFNCIFISVLDWDENKMGYKSLSKGEIFYREMEKGRIYLL